MQQALTASSGDRGLWAQNRLGAASRRRIPLASPWLSKAGLLTLLIADRIDLVCWEASVWQQQPAVGNALEADSFITGGRGSSMPTTPFSNPSLHLQGRPIYIQHLGQINVKKIMELTTDERSLRFHVQEYERCARYIMPACSKAANRHIEQTFAIIDVKGTPCTGPCLPASGSVARPQALAVSGE